MVLAEPVQAAIILSATARQSYPSRPLASSRFLHYGRIIRPVLGASGATAGDQDGSVPRRRYTPYALREGLYQRGGTTTSGCFRNSGNRTWTALLLSTTRSHAWSPRCSAWIPIFASPACPFQLFAGRRYARLLLQEIARPCATQAPATRSFFRSSPTVLLRRESLSGRNQFQGEAAASKFARGMTRPCRSRTGIGNGQAHVWPTNCLETEKEPVEIKLAHSPDSDDAFMFMR